MNTNSSLLGILCVFLLLCSCSGQRTTKSVETEKTRTIAISYANLFSIHEANDYTTVTVLNPWQQGEVYAKYHLVKNNETTVPADGYKVKIPLESLMTNSATHLGFLELLGELDKVTGVCSADYIYNPTIRQRVKEGRVQDLGDSFNLDIEHLLLLRPQAVMTTAYNADDENSRKMMQTGLTILYNIEWQEETLLGRAEWIKFIGAFFDKAAQADSLFTTIETGYNEVKTLASTIDGKPTVLSGQDFRGSWSMPGGRSFNAQLFRDAGGSYYYENDKGTGSINNTIEEALVHFGKADVWVGVQANTLEELGKMDSKYKLFKAYKGGNVYNANKRVNETGGNDYWEGAVARPDLLLSDMMKVFHPELLPEYEFTYIQKVE
ncbi:ABC transporter substrate-binding protein [Bacteroides sp. 224]|uniref:ABC transporter substrate-binding protein n=1 Tax=Bacteroides sp. 224 TaxID=2302936 RepID=UPI0013D1FA06|nr:ABC transporter substrate-binding protein [Bacteroides sp. 224]NDV66792.1 iron ABC transporter substrate-binding protein [Bacteroides sp. 224]